MKKRTFHLLFFFPFLLIAYGGCKKETLQNQIDKLPPITQEGKRTFGCLVNGKAWIPESENAYVTTPPLRFYYESINGGLFYLRAQKILTSLNISEEINIALDSCTTSKRYNFESKSESTRFVFTNDKTRSECQTLFSKDNDVITTGFVNLTRFDLNSGIISGTFEFTLSKKDCETISITHGRFDAKL